MIETLTLPATGSAIHPGAKAAAATAGGIDFAALFGTAGTGAEGFDPTGDATTKTAVGLPTVAAPTLAAATSLPSVSPPVAVTPLTPVTAALGDPATPVGDATAVEAASPPPADPATLLTAAVAGKAPETTDVPESEGDAPAVAAALPGIKPLTVRPHGPVVADDDSSVKLPTLPPGFIAQKAPKLPLAGDEAGSEDQQEEATDDDAAVAAAPPPPQSAICLAPAPQAAPTPAVATTFVPDAPIGRRGPSSPKVADKVELAAKSGDATTAAAMTPAVTTEAAPSSPIADLAATHSPAAGPAAASQSPVLAPTLPVGTLVPPPTAGPAPADGPQQSVALDDLMVAGAGDSAWLDRVASDISTLAKGDSREAHMKINPRSLGDMSIRLDMDGARTRVHFTVDTPQAQAMIADAAPKLTALVQANGLKLDGTTVDLNQQRRDGQSGQAQQQQQADTPSAFTAKKSEVARLVERTRIATRTDRFA